MGALLEGVSVQTVFRFIHNLPEGGIAGFFEMKKTQKKTRCPGGEARPPSKAQMSQL